MLIEVMVTLALLSGGLLGLARIVTQLVPEATLISQREEATRLAQQKLEQWRLFESSTQQAQRLSAGSDEPSAVSAPAAVGGTAIRFSRSWQVSTMPAGPAVLALSQGRVVSVVVSWPDPLGQTQTVRLRSYLNGLDPLLTAGLWFPVIDGTILRKPGAS